MKKKKQQEGFFEETINLNPSNNIQSYSSQDFQPIQYPQTDTGMSERISEQRAKKLLKEKIKANAFKFFLIALCCYMVFLIVGVVRTNYYIDSETGTRQPIYVTYKDVADKDDYNKLKKEMTKLRNIIIDIRTIEIKYANGDLPADKAASEYNNILKRVDVTIPKLTALSVGDAQKPIQSAMLSCYSVHLAGYLQEMYKGLSSNNQDALNTALIHRDAMYKSYYAAQDYLKQLGTRLKLADEYFDWNLDEEVAKKDPTAILKEKE